MVEPPDPKSFRPTFLRELERLPQLEPVVALPTVKPVPASCFLAEENVLLLEARSLGKPWSEVARMLPEKSLKALKRQLTLLQRPKVP